MTLAAVLADVGVSGVKQPRAEHRVTRGDFGDNQNDQRDKRADQGKRGKTAKFVIVHRIVAQNDILRYRKSVA